MRKLFIYTVIFLPLFALAQGKYTINAKVDSLKNGSKVHLVYRLNGAVISDSTIIKEGRFSFQGTVENPVQAQLFLNQNPYIFSVRGQKIDNYSFYIEPGALQLSAKDSLKNITVKGSKINDLEKERLAMLKNNSAMWDAMNKEFAALPKEKQEDSATRQIYIDREKALYKEFNQINLGFAQKHPDLTSV